MKIADRAVLVTGANRSLLGSSKESESGCCPRRRGTNVPSPVGDPTNRHA
jgi:hypothetical protein